MSAADSPAEALSPMVKKAMYLSHFTPSMMPPETLQGMLVQRGSLLERTVDSVVHSVKTTAKHHHLFVGPRGIGKTHLISLIHHQISQNPAVQSKALIAWMREEEWGVTSFMELVLRILRTLDQTYPELDIAAQTQALYELSIAQAEEQATQILLQTLGDKTLVILLENLDDLFDQLKPTSQKQLRALIQNHPQFVLVATTPSLFTAVTSQNSPFYGFFDIDPLEELSFEEVVELLEKIALERGDTGLATFIQSTEGRARIRAVHHLAEGNPRIYIIFAQFLTQEALDELVQAFMHTLDELTPYYQARMKELSGQQRKIVEYLVHYRGAATVKQIAKSCFITQQVCSGQLKQLREKRAVRSIERGRESYYELAEPLMRLCMDVKQQRGEPIGILVEILRIWYTEKEIEEFLKDDQVVLGTKKHYLEAALQISKSQKIEPTVSAIFRELDGDIGLSQQISLLKELSQLRSKNKGVELLQIMMKIVLPEIQQGNLSVKEECWKIGEGAARMMEFVISASANKKIAVKTQLPLFLKVSAKLYQENPKSAEPLFNVLLEQVVGFVGIGVIEMVKVMLTDCNADAKWFEALMGSSARRLSSRRIYLILSRVLRIMDAINSPVNSDGQLVTLSMPREERIFIEDLHARMKKKENSNG